MTKQRCHFYDLTISYLFLDQVNLRNHLGASCRTIREEMNEESDEFLELFSEEIVYFDGARTQSGFYAVEKAPFSKRLYRGYVNGPSVVKITFIRFLLNSIYCTNIIL